MAKRDRWSSSSTGTSKSKRRKKTTDFEVFVPENRLDRVPDNVALKIMFYLDLRSLLLMSRACKRFYQLSRDDSLWVNVDMTTLPSINVKQFKKLIRENLSPKLHTVIIESEYPQKNRPKKPKINEQILNELIEKCPSIESVTLHKCDLTNVLFHSKLPQCSSLKSVSIISCNTPLHYLKSVNWPSLNHLSLANSVMTTHHEIQAILQSEHWQKSLMSLDVSNCYRFNEFNVQNTQMSLRKLNLSSTSINDDSLDQIGKLQCLEELYLRCVKGLTEKGLLKLPVILPHLKKLDLTNIENISREVLEQIKEQMTSTIVLY